MTDHRSAAVTPFRQGGASAIEFALVFPLFFLLFYGLVSWGLILTLQHGLNYAAQSAARAALAADPMAAGYEARVVTLARDAAGMVLGWMPESWRQRVLGADNSQVQVEIVTVFEAGEPVDWLRVRISYPQYRDQPLLPLLRLAHWGTFPPAPEQLIAEAMLRL